MGAVYAGIHVELDRPIAVKLLLPNFQADPQAFERFRREARAAARIKHPNVADVYDYGALENDEAYIVMELVEGETLHERLKREGQLPFAEIVTISRQIAEGMEAAHQSGVVHRDLKPSNIILNQNTDGNMQVKIIDFGIAKISEQITADESTLTATGMLVGTPRYMSPEQCLGEELDARSDVYSFGLIVYEMLAGHAPFDATSAVAIALKHVQEPPAPLDLYRQNVPALLADLVADSLAIEPSQRPQTATDIKHRLEQIDLALTEYAISDEVGHALPDEDVDQLRTQVMKIEDHSVESNSVNALADEYATAVIEAQPPEKEAAVVVTHTDEATVAKTPSPDKDSSAPRPFFDVKTGAIKQAVPLTLAPVSADDHTQPVPAAANISDKTKIRRRRNPAFLYAGITAALIVGVIAVWAVSQRASSKQPEPAMDAVAMHSGKQSAASPTPNLSASPTPSADMNDAASEQTRTEIDGALDDWIAATNAGDLNRQMAFYNPTIDAFYLTRNVSRDAVRAEKQRLFGQAEKFEVQASEPVIKLGKEGQTATTRFNKRYVIEGQQGKRQGEVIQELRWTKTDAGWKIVSERDVRVIQNPNKASPSRKEGSSMWPHKIVLRGVKKLFRPLR
ncbi:MAG: protein kinase [Acidobacteriota bacterium]|nr:protein kinase [Acidobacteriota bacterium]